MSNGPDLYTEDDPSSRHYDPELPFLATLEAEIARKAIRVARRRELASIDDAHREARVRSRASGARVTSSAGDRRRPGISLSRASRVARRSLTLVTLLCLIGASAFGAREILSSHSNPAVVQRGPFVLVASGRIGTDLWSLRLYRRETDLCEVLVVAEAESSNCAPPPARKAFTVTSVTSPRLRYVFGIAGDEVPAVTVHAGHLTRTVTTSAPPDTSAGRAGLPTKVRYFLTTVPRPHHGSDPRALVYGLDTRRRRQGPTRVSCVETGGPRSCR